MDIGKKVVLLIRAGFLDVDMRPEEMVRVIEVMEVLTPNFFKKVMRRAKLIDELSRKESTAPSSEEDSDVPLTEL